MLERAKADQLIYEPGTNWNYSNIGYFFVREIIEQTTGEPLGQALDRLVLQPLGLVGVRLATTRGELAPDYNSRWVYHGSLIGPLTQAALFMDRLLSGRLFSTDRLAAMLACTPLSAAGLSWKSVGYGLGIARRAERNPASSSSATTAADREASSPSITAAAGPPPPSVAMKTRRPSSKAARRCLSKGHDSRRHRSPCRLARPPWTGRA